MEQETSNVQESAPSQVHDEDASKAFFSALDTSVNSGIIDPQQEPSETTSSKSIVDTIESPREVQQNDSVNWEKRYNDSSREGKRLNQQLQSLEPYMPILDAMKDDPNLISHVRNYFEGGGQAPVSVKERLKLDEDFVFDQEEAYGTPDSDSAKLMNATVDGIVQKRLQQALSHQQSENAKLTQENSFRSKYDIKDEEWTDFVDFAKNHRLKLDDIYYLKNRKSRESNIEQEANSRVSSQMERTQSQPTSLAASGSASVEKSSDDSLFDAILGIDQQLNNAFG